MSKLTADAVRNLARKALCNVGEDVSPLIVDGLVNNFGFHPDRIKAMKPEVDALLLELPEQFQKDKGGGWSFLNACMDREGNQWGEHRDIEALVCLGIGAGSASWMLKDMADVLPGGMPYFEVHPS